MIKPKKIVWEFDKYGLVGKIKCFEFVSDKPPYRLYCCLTNKTFNFETKKQAKIFAKKSILYLTKELIEKEQAKDTYTEQKLFTTQLTNKDFI